MNNRNEFSVLHNESMPIREFLKIGNIGNCLDYPGRLYQKALKREQIIENNTNYGNNHMHLACYIYSIIICI